MKSYLEMTKEELQALHDELSIQYEEEKAKGYDLDMSRGKPSPNQLTLSMEMYRNNDTEHWRSEDGTDCRNYGAFDGVIEGKRLMSWIMDCREDQVIMGGNSSLSMMYDCVVRAMMFGILGSKPWKDYAKISFLCPVPGYDRHFKICEQMGINMINVPMTSTGPDMDIVEKLVSSDETIKGIWCVPKFSNPDGTVYSAETVKRMAALKPAAKDFRVFWDNAYAIHYLYKDNQPKIPNILEECEKAGNPDLVYEFSSTSKVTFSGSGLAAFAASDRNLKEYRKGMSVRTIGYDKMNMLRHADFLNSPRRLMDHMMEEAEFIRPKFRLVEQILETELAGTGAGRWSRPLGGYFVSFDAYTGCAAKIVEKCKACGVTLTPAGASFPYGKDPRDSNIRLAPTFPSIYELTDAMKLFVLCVKLAVIEKIMQEKDTDPVIYKVFTEKDYEKMLSIEDSREKVTYYTEPYEDWVVKITHKPQRFMRERMLYIVQLNHYLGDNLANDDLYWRAEPKKFFNGTPSLRQIWDALQGNLDYFNDKEEFHMAKLNLQFDKIEFDS